MAIGFLRLRRKSFDSAIKAIEERNLNAYKSATDELKKELPSDIKLLENKSEK